MGILTFVFLFSAMVSRAQTTSMEFNQVPSDSSTSDQSSQITDGKSIFKTKKIEHPGTREGLFLIDEEGVYHYKVTTVSKRDDSLYFRFVSMTPPSITTEIGGNTYGYETFYGNGQLTGVDFIYEWQPWKNFGKAGFQLGLGLLMANGEGIFARDTLTEIPRESFTLFSIPLSAGIIYRFEYMNRQWVVPYISGGGIYNGLVEYRDDGEMTTVGAPAAYGAGGLMLNLTAMNRDLAFTMDREYGFSNLWLTAEFRINYSFSEDLDVSSDQISIGIGADY